MYNGQLGVATDDNGLYYMRSRYYNPDIKRFINQDVLIGSITNSNSLNRYSYVEGNPVSYTDPFGLSPFSYLNMFNPSVLIHTTLDVLGCLPGGSGFDLVNAAIYFLEGNDKEGWKSLFFAIPGMDLAGKGMKWGAKIGGKGGKILENTLKAVDMAGHLKAIQLSATDFGNDIAFMIDKYMVGEAEWSSETAWELVSLAGHGFQLKSFSGSFMNNVNAGTYDSVIPGMSTANIDLYKVGDWLSQYDFIGNRGGTNFHGDSDFGNKSGITSSKAINFPSSKKVEIDMDEVISGHTYNGKRAQQSQIKDLFPNRMDAKDIEKEIREAYSNAKQIGGPQFDGVDTRIKLQGYGRNGVVEMWYNKTTKTIETAYPIYGKKVKI